MNRRQFLTVATAVTAVGMVRLASPRLVAAKGLTPILRQTLYKGTKDGQLYESVDGGKTWQLVADFGSHCAISQIFMRPGNDLQIKLICAGYSFDLHSKDARVWRTI